MQALDSFISPVLGFDGDIPIPDIPVSAWPAGDGSMSDPSIAASANTLKTQAGKREATVNPIPHKKTRKTTGKPTSRIKINELAPNATALTPPSGPRWKISIQC
jgi:hypothetical protein